MVPNDFASMSKPWLEALRAAPMANGDAGADPLALLKLAFGLSGARAIRAPSIVEWLKARN